MNPGDSQRAGIFFLAIFCLVIYGSSLFIAGRSRLVKPIPFGRQDNGSMAVEVQGGKKDGIYFLPTGTGLGSLFPSVVPDDMEITPGSLWSLSPEGKLQKGTMSAAVRLALDIPLDVNLATVPDLSLVPGLGEKTALAIVSRRDERGGFSSLDELKEVPGIKEKRLARIRRFLFVGEKGKLQKGTMSASVNRPSLDAPLDVNKANVPDLSLVPGIGEKTALAIVSRRDERGGFSSLDELKEVPGIKEKRLARIRHFLSVGEKR